MNEAEAVLKPRKRRRLAKVDRSETVVCGAKTRSGEHCKRHSAPGKSRCHYHGGAPDTGAPTGKANGNWKDGRYSRVMSLEQRQHAWRDHWARKRLEWARERCRGDR